jgi:hypothetical protein
MPDQRVRVGDADVGAWGVYAALAGAAIFLRGCFARTTTSVMKIRKSRVRVFTIVDNRTEATVSERRAVLKCRSIQTEPL